MNILIVDDEIDTLNEINFYVKKHNNLDSSVICTNPIQALEEAEKTCFDIALQKLNAVDFQASLVGDSKHC